MTHQHPAQTGHFEKVDKFKRYITFASYELMTYEPAKEKYCYRNVNCPYSYAM